MSALTSFCREAVLSASRIGLSSSVVRVLLMSVLIASTTAAQPPSIARSATDAAPAVPSSDGGNARTPQAAVAQAVNSVSDAARALVTAQSLSGGALWSWGLNNHGQLGDGTVAQRTAPIQVPSMTGLIAIAAGASFSLAVKADGTLWSWGDNGSGQLGDGTTKQRTSAVRVTTLNSVKAVSAGDSFSIALRNDGTVWTWGDNLFGQLGNGPSGLGHNEKSPILVAGLSGIIAVSAGGSSAMALGSDGTVWAWGNDGSGQLGFHSNSSVSTPQVVSGLTNVVAISMGPLHSLVMKRDGTAWASGRGAEGQIGDGVNTTRYQHVQVAGLTGVTAVAAIKGYSSLAVRSDGTAWAWGQNDRGQLGDGTTTQRSTPVQVLGGLSAIYSLSAGAKHSVAVRADGTVWAWGSNDQGQLGDGTTVQHNLPSQVPGLTRITGSASGLYFNVAGEGLPLEPAPAGTAQNRPLINAATAGLSVNTANGGFVTSHTDVMIAGRGPSPVFARSYNSNDTRVTALGPGWTHSYSVHLSDSGDGAVILVGPQGRSDRFVGLGGGAYSAPIGVYVTLARNVDGSYSATMTDQSAWSFDPSGRLAAISDRYGNRSQLTYDASGRLTSVSDPASRGSLTFTYNASGLLATVGDWLSPQRLVQFTYDAGNRLRTVMDRAGGITTYGYDATGRLSTITDPLLHTAVSLTYDAQGRVASEKDARGVTTGEQTTFSYTNNPDGTSVVITTYPTTSADPSWHGKVTDSYDASGFLVQRLTQPSSTENYTVRYTYDAAGHRTSTTDARGQTTTYCYDVSVAGVSLALRGNVTRTISPAPAAGGYPLVSLAQYDDKNNVLQSIPPRGVQNGAVVNCATDLTAAADARFATDFAYDTTARLLLSKTTRFTDPDFGLQTSLQRFEYADAQNPGRVTRMIVPRGNLGPQPDYTYSVVYQYNVAGSQAGMLSRVTDQDGNVTTYTYDAVGRRLSLTDGRGNAVGGDPLAHRWEYTYDNEDRMRLTKSPAPVSGGSVLVIERRYDAAGNNTVVIDANGQVTKYVYDERNKLGEVQESSVAWSDPNVTPASLIRTTYAYDNLGKLSRLTRAAGDGSSERVVDYSYDGMARLRSETQYPNWPATGTTLQSAAAYDANSNLVTLTDALGQVTTFTYDDENRNTAVSFSDGATPNATFVYDAAGNRIAMTNAIGTTSFAYDESNRLTSSTAPGSVTVGFRYDVDGHRTKVIYPDATAVSYFYDKAGLLASLSDWAGRTTTYTYDATSMPIAVAAANGTSSSFVYDNALRLTRAQYLQGQQVFAQFDYGLDADGNRTSANELMPQVGGGSSTSSITYAYDRLNRLTGDGSTTFTYDPVGNRASMTRGADTTMYTYDRADRLQTAGTANYTFDARGDLAARASDSFSFDQANRLVGMTIAGVTSTFNYDPAGNRVAKTTGTTTTTYTYDFSTRLPVVLDDGMRKLVWGLNLAYSVDRGGVVSVYHLDGVGSVRAMTDQAGSVTATYGRDAFGSRTAAQGTTTQQFDFAGEVRDEESGFINLRARLYDPATGRFISRDTFNGFSARPGSLNRYTYAENNPVSRSDPSGRYLIADDPGGCADPSCAPTTDTTTTTTTDSSSSTQTTDPAAVQPTTITCDLCGLIANAIPGAPLVDAAWSALPDYVKPDYVKAVVDVGFLNWGSTAQVTVDRYGEIYVQPFTGAHISALPGISGSATAGYLLQGGVPSPEELQNFIGGWTISGGGGPIVGAQVTYSPSVDKTAFEVGVFVPANAGFSAGYSQPVQEYRLPGW